MLKRERYGTSDLPASKEIYHNDAWLVTILLRLCSMGDASLYNNSFLWISQKDVTQLFSTPATLSVEDKAAPLVGVRS